MIKCVAIDDEPIALSIITEYCRMHGDIDLKCFTSPVEGMEYISTIRPDIVFLDIEMNSHSGLDLARNIPKESCLIFTTAYSQYAIDGFNVNAVDFLHKPIFFARFEQAMEKAQHWLDRRSGATQISAITLKVEHKNVIIDIDRITHIEAMDNYVKVFRTDAPMVLSQVTMKEMEEMLPRDRFFRVHRSFIVALKAIDRFSNRKIFLHGVNRQVPVGRKYNESFNRLYKSLYNPTKTINNHLNNHRE